MNWAASRAICFAIILIAPFCVRGAEAAGRVAPSRPAGGPPPAPSSPLVTKKIGGAEYVSVASAAVRLGLKAMWLERGKRVALVGPAGRAELENDSRDVTVNGLRVFLGDPVMDARGELYVSRIDFERCLTPLFQPGQDAPSISAPKTIVLDPGHGGRDTGTSVKEKTFALDVALRAKKLLEASGQRVVLTRETDVFLDLPQRGAIANAQHADLFASIHFNAVAHDAKTSGVEIFTFAPQFQRSTNSWGSKTKEETEKEPAPVNRYDHWSVVLAQALQKRFVTDLKNFDRGKKLAHWGVLRGVTCPAVLIECGFLTSDSEARKIATPEYRQKLAEALAAGIRDYAQIVDGSRTRNAGATVAYQNSSASSQ